MLPEVRASTAENRMWGFASAAAAKVHPAKASTWLPLAFLSLQHGPAQRGCHAPLLCVELLKLLLPSPLTKYNLAAHVFS